MVTYQRPKDLKWRVICAGVQRLIEQEGLTEEDVSLWIDWQSIYQDDKAEKLKGVVSLIRFATLCQYMLVPTEEAKLEGDAAKYPRPAYQHTTSRAPQPHRVLRLRALGRDAGAHGAALRHPAGRRPQPLPEGRGGKRERHAERRCALQPQRQGAGHEPGGQDDRGVRHRAGGAQVQGGGRRGGGPQQEDAPSHARGRALRGGGALPGRRVGPGEQPTGSRGRRAGGGSAEDERHAHRAQAPAARLALEPVQGSDFFVSQHARFLHLPFHLPSPFAQPRQQQPRPRGWHGARRGAQGQYNPQVAQVCFPAIEPTARASRALDMHPSFRAFHSTHPSSDASQHRPARSLNATSHSLRVPRASPARAQSTRGLHIHGAHGRPRANTLAAAIRARTRRGPRPRAPSFARGCVACARARSHLHLSVAGWGATTWTTPPSRPSKRPPAAASSWTSSIDWETWDLTCVKGGRGATKPATNQAALTAEDHLFTHSATYTCGLK
eukprot:scaffold20245_cov57-Phaeocystis_antarctica.AAC.1